MTLATAPRYRAALRTPPLPCGHRDPILCETTPSGPSTYSLDRAELAAEAARCRAAGWTSDEVAERLAVPA
ncbi:hypothetical protein RM572_26975 [Streptomyces sp. DSM 42041]|uniref:Uncharacterized protein n=1 Tax=Streptomyces hazeniae TaxID=3075538 RepID=A0ABU2NZK1_9ACTN|nr:hypothetical protein [Streptomyces sp. DSM 42041]MDT0382408.1 hypothetical protein [Streptomyces sp. DSM 42041]